MKVKKLLAGALAVAMSGGTQWKPIRHTVAVSLGELDGRR